MVSRPRGIIMTREFGKKLRVFPPEEVEIAGMCTKSRALFIGYFQEYHTKKNVVACMEKIKYAYTF